MIITKETRNVEQLRKAGYKVRVYHGRSYYDMFGREYIMSKREFENQEDVLATISSYGGFTSVEITTPDGQTLKGKFNVRSGEQFNRKLGLKAAIGRAFKHAE